MENLGDFEGADRCRREQVWEANGYVLRDGPPLAPPYEGGEMVQGRGRRNLRADDQVWRISGILRGRIVVDVSKYGKPTDMCCATDPPWPPLTKGGKWCRAAGGEIC